MKKSKLALLLAGVLSLFVFAACSNSTGGDSGSGGGSDKPSTDNKEYVTVTFDAGEKGYFVYSSQQTKTVKVEKGTVCTETIAPSIQSAAYSYYEFDAYYKENATEAFDFSTPITEDITLLAKYCVKAAEIKSIYQNYDGTKFTFEPYHASRYLTISDFTYALTVKDVIENKVVYTAEGDVSELTSKVEVTGLTHGNKCEITIETIYKGEHSKPVQAEAYPVKEVKFLMLMYMDGDNNLNNPIFLDMNEAEYGLSKLSTYNQDKIAILALWDGWTGDKDNVVFEGTSGTRLLQLAADAGEVYADAEGNSVTQAGMTLSENTKDFSSKFDWLASGEVDMSKKETLVNFLKSANNLFYVSPELISTNKTILQFSNHGGGPRAIKLPKKAILPNGKEIQLVDKSGRRAMCWDETSGGETFLKTSDISAALKEAGYSSNNKFGIIIEDVCLGGSIEEAYELKDYTSYYIGSPNNVPGKGLDYTTLVEAINKRIFTASFENMLSVGHDVCKKYKEDYAYSSEVWAKYITDTLNKMLEDDDFKTFYEALTSKEQEEYIKDLKIRASLHLSDMCTISMVSTSNFFNVKYELNRIVDEILNNGNVYCKKLFYDVENAGITTTAPTAGSDKILPITRSLALQELSLRPYDAINYQGNFSWLYDLGYVVDNMAYVAAVEEWSELYSALNSLAGELKKMISFAWRDGCENPTYSTDLTNNPYFYGWLGWDEKNGKAVSDYLHYGLTISGETMKYTVDGDTVTIINGDYPSWYTELKFGQECKWNDLLKVWFSAQ